MIQKEGMEMPNHTYRDVIYGMQDNNIRFSDLRKLMLDLGFEERIKGDHFIYKKNGILERIVIQPNGNKAKAYQIKQVRQLIIKYNLEV